MAKISARGAHAIARFRKEFNSTGHPGDTYEVRRVLRSDLKVLEQRRGVWESYESVSRRVNDPEQPAVWEHLPWSHYRIAGKLRAEITPAEWVKLYESKGWTRD